MLLRFFDTTLMRAVTRFIDLPPVTDGSASAIFTTINDCLVRRGLKYEHLICFNSDTCNTMKGKRNGVVRHLQTSNQICLPYDVFVISKTLLLQLQ